MTESLHTSLNKDNKHYFLSNTLTKQRTVEGRAEREHCNFNNKARKTMCSEVETKQQQRVDMK